MTPPPSVVVYRRVDVLGWYASERMWAAGLSWSRPPGANGDVIGPRYNMYGVVGTRRVRLSPRAYLQKFPEQILA